MSENLLPHPLPSLLRRCATPMAMVWAGFGLTFAAALMLWLRYGAAIFVDGLAMAWSCF